MTWAQARPRATDQDWVLDMKTIGSVVEAILTGPYRSDIDMNIKISGSTRTRKVLIQSRCILLPTPSSILSISFYYIHPSIYDPAIMTLLRDHETARYVRNIDPPRLGTSALQTIAVESIRINCLKRLTVSLCTCLSSSTNILSHGYNQRTIVFRGTLSLLTSKYNNGTAKTPVHEAVMKVISVAENRSNSSPTYIRL